MAPPEGAKAIPIPLDFTTNATYSLDYGDLMQQRNFSMVQSLYVDNGANGSAVIIAMNGTGQSITFPANSQGYVSVLLQNPVKIDFTSAGLTAVKVFLLNFPVAGHIWSV